MIQTRLKDGWNPNKIAKEIGCAPNTVRNGSSAEQWYCTKEIFSATKPPPDKLPTSRTVKCAVGGTTTSPRKSISSRLLRRSFSKTDGHWMLASAMPLKEGLFTRGQIVCTKTLYSYADLGLLGIKNIHLPEKLRRSSKRVKILKNKRVLGRSIEERPLEANDRSEFGHWEADLVIGSKKKDDDTLIAMLERKTREYWMIRVPGRNPNGIMAALTTIRSQYSEHWDTIFKTITTDNGSRVLDVVRIWRT